MCSETLACSSAPIRKTVADIEYRYPVINTSLDECPLDTLVVLTDEYNNMYLGTITAKSNGQLTRGECIDGDAELFYRNKIVGWEPYHPT